MQLHLASTLAPTVWSHPRNRVLELEALAVWRRRATQRIKRRGIGFGAVTR